MSTRYSIAQARDHLARIVHDAERGEAIELTRRGKPVAVLISVHEYQRQNSGKGDFWEAICRFRREHDLEKLNIDFPTTARLRDRSPGRKPGK